MFTFCFWSSEILFMMAQSLLLSKRLGSLLSPSLCISQSVSSVVLSQFLLIGTSSVWRCSGCRVSVNLPGTVSQLGCLVQVFVAARAEHCHLAGSCSLSRQAVARQSTGSRVWSRTAVADSYSAHQVISSCYETRKGLPRYRATAPRKFAQAETFPS
jgi:hypothetical protein